MTYDEGNSVLVLDVDTGTTVEEWTVPESGMLSDIAVYGGHLFVTDALKNCIYVLDMEGKRERSFGTKGSGDGRFKCPEGLAIADELIYICDCGNGRVQVFTLDGTWVRAWGSKGVGKGEFKSPSSITVHGGEVYVADTENYRTQVFDLNGNFRRVYSFESCPFGVIVHDEFVYMTDGLKDRIQIWDLAENTSAGQIGHFGSDIGELNMPVGLCVDYMDRLWVCDKDNSRLQVFR
jgi:DNA-binding beta-propeller fold protein YncE